MPLTSLAQVQDVIGRAGLTRMIAYDASGYTVDHAEEDSAGALADRVQECVGNNTGTIRIEAWQPPPARVPGQRKADAPKVERYSWHVRGTYGQQQPATPGAAPAHPVESAPPVNIAEALRTARLEWEVELLRVQLKEANTRTVTDDDDDDDDDAPGTNGSLWGMTGDQTFQVLQGIGQLIPQVLPGLTGRTIGGTGAPGIKAPSNDELQVLEAMRRYRAANPEEANGILSALMEGYGPNAKPSSDGK